jgi:signal transduction histidine kinase
VKYAGEGNTRPTLRFEVESTSESVVLKIGDNGIGVSPVDLPFIFDKGFTGEQGNRPGRATGMGLFLVGKMARDLAIEPDARSEPGTGLEISLRFPGRG